MPSSHILRLCLLEGKVGRRKQRQGKGREKDGMKARVKASQQLRINWGRKLFFPPVPSFWFTCLSPMPVLFYVSACTMFWFTLSDACPLFLACPRSCAFSRRLCVCYCCLVWYLVVVPCTPSHIILLPCLPNNKSVTTTSTSDPTKMTTKYFSFFFSFILFHSLFFFYDLLYCVVFLRVWVWVRDGVGWVKSRSIRTRMRKGTEGRMGRGK